MDTGPTARGLAMAVMFCAASAVAGPSLSEGTSRDPAAEDHALTAFGISLYGTIDIGMQYDTHGLPVSDYYVEGAGAFIRPNDNRSIAGLTPSNLGQSAIGLKGSESLFQNLSGVFRVETFLNPQSGEISDSLRSLALNNGRPLNQQVTGLDSSVAGETFETAYAGIESRSFGSLLFGRITTILSDGVAKYDAQRVSATFSLLGAQGTAAGGGDTENRRISSSIKYFVKLGDVHFGADIKIDGLAGTPKSLQQFNLGGELGGTALDAYYSRVKGAISASSLSFAQVNELPELGFSSNSALAGTISDNTTIALMGMKGFGAVDAYAGYEFIRYTNPSTPLTPGFQDIGGYTLAFVNNAAYEIDRQLQIYWTGVRYSADVNWDLAFGYYAYRQNSYATGPHAGCSTAADSGCSGTQEAVSLATDYRLSKRFDTYVGAMYTEVKNGLASGFLHRSMVASTVGLRFTF